MAADDADKLAAARRDAANALNDWLHAVERLGDALAEAGETGASPADAMLIQMHRNAIGDTASRHPILRAALAPLAAPVAVAPESRSN